jgi:hypothetical protein
VTCSSDQFQTTETIGAVFNGSCTNDAGLSTNASSLTVKLDKTGPSAALSVTAGTAGANGWYTSDVTVHTAGSDTISPPVTCSSDQFQTTETIGAVFNGSCTNDAGLSTNASPLTVKLDKTNPMIAITSPATGYVTVAPTITVSGTDSDTPSGIDTVTVSGFPASLGSGSFSSTGTTSLACGLNTITAVATDLAGRTTTSGSISVTRVCVGGLQYYAPIDQSTGSTIVVNTGKFGRVIPVKVNATYNVGGASQALTQAVMTANGLTMIIGVNGASCSNGAASDDLETYADAGSSSSGTNAFRWDTSQWIYNLDTGHAPSVVMTIGSCYRLDVYIVDSHNAKVLLSSTPYALFKPTK